MCETQEAKSALSCVLVFRNPRNGECARARTHTHTHTHTSACMHTQVLARKDTEEGRKMLAGGSRNHDSAVPPCAKPN